MFAECLALSSEIGLTIGIMDEIQKSHVQTYPLGESPGRIAHCEQSGVYAGESSCVLLMSCTADLCCLVLHCVVCCTIL